MNLNGILRHGRGSAHVSWKFIQHYLDLVRRRSGVGFRICGHDGNGVSELKDFFITENRAIPAIPFVSRKGDQPGNPVLSLDVLMGNDFKNSRHFFRCRSINRENIGMRRFGLNQGKPEGSSRHFKTYVSSEIRSTGHLGNGAGPWIFASPDTIVGRHLECQIIFSHLAAQYPGRIHHRIHQGFVSCAAAGVSMFLKPVPDILAGGAEIGIQQSFGRNNEAWTAETALGCAMNCPGKLNGMKFVRPADSLDGRDAGIIRNPAHFGDAGANHLAVQDHRTAPALSLAASDLCSGQFELFTQRIGQKRIRVHHHHLHFTIDIHIFSNHAVPPIYGMNTNTIRPASAGRCQPLFKPLDSGLIKYQNNYRQLQKLPHGICHC